MGLTKKFHLGRSFSLILTLFLTASMGVTGMFLTAYGRTNQQAEQFEDWKYSQYLPLEDTVGVDRVLEPAEYFLEFPDEQCLNATKEIRVATADGVEVPCQVYNVSTYESGYVAACNVVWQANCSAFSTAEHYIYWGNPAATEPTYSTDIAVEISDVNITIWNSHYKVSLTKEKPEWYGISDTIQYLYYKPYDPTLNLGRADWHQILQTVINVPPYWFLPFGGAPIKGTNVTVEESGPLFIEVKAVYGNWKIAGVNSLVKTYRFYAHLPWFLLTSDFNLTGANYEHIQTEAYLSTTALPYATFRTKSGSLKTMDIRPDTGDELTWDCTWIDAENINTTDNPVGLGFIAMPGTDPPITGFRSDKSGIAPFQNGTLLSARQNLAILLHQGNYIAAEQLYNQTQKLLLPPPLLHAITSITILATIIDKVSGVAAPSIKVELLFRDNGTLYREIETNELGTAIFRDVPSGNYTVRARGESANVTVSLTRAYWQVRLRVMIPRFTGLIYMGIAIGVGIALIAVISVTKRRK